MKNLKFKSVLFFPNNFAENVNIAYKERCTDHLSRYCPTEHQDRYKRFF